MITAEEKPCLQHTAKTVGKTTERDGVVLILRHKLYDPRCIRIGAGGGTCIGLAPGRILGKIAAGDDIPGIGCAGDGTGAVVAQAKITEQHDLLGHLLFDAQGQIGDEQGYDGVHDGTGGHKIVEHHGPGSVVKIALATVAAVADDVERTGPDFDAFIGTSGCAQLQSIVAIKKVTGWSSESQETAYHGISKHCV